MYYYVSACVWQLLTLLLYGVLAKCYKLRARNEVINIHHVVATAYERYLEQAEENNH